MLIKNKIFRLITFISLLSIALCACDTSPKNEASDGSATQTSSSSTSEVEVVTSDIANLRNTDLVWDEEIREQDFNGLTVCVVGYGDSLQMLLNNNSGETRQYGGQYKIQVKENGSYQDVSTNSDVPFDENIYDIEHEQIFVTEFDITCFNCSKPGEYRFIYGDLYGDFILK